MQVSTFSFEHGVGWSVPAFPEVDSDQTLVLVFGASGTIEDIGPLTELVRAYPRSVIVGCSSAGEIHGSCISDDGLAVAVVRFESARLRFASTSIGGERSSVEAGVELARSLSTDGLRAVFVLSDGTSVNGTDLLRGLHGGLRPDVVVTGGLAGDGTRFSTTWVLVDGRPRTGMISAVGLYGERVGVSHGSQGGWDVFGPERVVTRSEGNVLYELDGEPALALYKLYLGDRAAGLPATALLFPLALRSEAQSTSVVRTVLSVDEATQSLTFAGDIPQGSVVQLMRANFERLIEGASLAGHDAEPRPDQASLTIAISCVGRRLVLGERAEEEVEAALEATPGAPLVGFYSYGEISPYAKGECAILHNQTMTVTRLWEN